MHSKHQNHTDNPGTGYVRLQQLVIVSVCLIIISSTAYTAWKSYRSKQIIIKAAELQTQAYARSLKEHTERTFSEIDFILKAKSRQIEQSGRLSREQLTRLLREDIQNISQISSLALADPSGQVTAISLPNAPLISIQDRLYYRHHLQDNSNTLFITPPFRSKISGNWRISLSRRINSPTGSFAGILVATLDIGYFEKLYADLAEDRNARYSLALLSGSYLMLVPDPANVYESGKKMNAAQLLRYSGEPFGTYRPAQSNVFRQPRITSYHRLDRYPVVAIMSFNKDQVLADWKATLTKDIVTYSAFALLLAALTKLLIRQIRSIEQANGYLVQKNDELTSARQNAEKAREEAELATNAKSAFLATMSHEIRTPMNAIIGLTTLTLESDLTAQQRNHLKRLEQASHTLLSVINDILDFSKIEAHKLDLECREFSLPDLLEQTIGLYQITATQKGLEFHVTTKPELPCMVSGDPVRLRQILNNLISNAVKFTDTGSVSVTAELAEQSNQTVVVRFQISDTGIGIDPQQLNTLFQPFTQADNSIARRFGGTGLGLSIVKHLVELMGGSIAVSSRSGSGSSFACTIPLGIWHDETAAEPPKPQQPLADLALSILGARILLVEDNEANQYVARQFLTRAGLEISIACNGSEAVEQFSTGRFDAILMDMQMPVMDGIEATRAIRSLPDGVTVPIIAMTAATSDVDRDRCLTAGMNDYLSKPIVPTEMVKKLSAWLQISRSGGTNA